MNIKGTRRDFVHRGKMQRADRIVVEKEDEKDFYKVVRFPKHFSKKELGKVIEDLLEDFLSFKGVTSPFHAFVVGIGNDSYTTDSIGPKTIKKIKVNSHFEEVGVEIVGNVVSTLEPGVLGETGISTLKIVESVSKQIKPDVVILIDSLVTDEIEELGHMLVLSDDGLIPGSGLAGINERISAKELRVPVLAIGVGVALELKIKSSHEENIYLLTGNDVDKFVEDVAECLSEGLNAVFFKGRKV